MSDICENCGCDKSLTNDKTCPICGVSDMKDKTYLIYAGTGCTCCNNENHYRGPFKTREDAERRIAYYKSADSKYWPLASQYARRGVYDIEEVHTEILPDGRAILNGRIVVDKLEFIKVNDDGAIEDNESERFDDYDV